MIKKVRIAYIGGGSRLWARNLMSDLALEKEVGFVLLHRSKRGVTVTSEGARLVQPIREF